MVTFLQNITHNNFVTLTDKTNLVRENVFYSFVFTLGEGYDTNECPFIQLILLRIKRIEESSEMTIGNEGEHGHETLDRYQRSNSDERELFDVVKLIWAIIIIIIIIIQLEVFAAYDWKQN